MADTSPRQPRYVELLPPVKSTAQQPIPQTNNRLPATAGENWLPAPLIQRVLDKIAAKNAQATAGRIAAENQIVVLLTERLRLLEEFGRKLGRFEALPALRHAAAAQAYAEAEEIFDNINYERRMRLMRQEAELNRAQRELDDLKRGPAPALPPPQKEKKSKAAKIKEIQEECEMTITALRAGRSDDELDEDTRELIDDCKLAAKEKIKAILQSND